MPCLRQQQRDEQPSNTPVAIAEGMDLVSNKISLPLSFFY
jgi:hypothetical protein